MRAGEKAALTVKSAVEAQSRRSTDKYVEGAMAVSVQDLGHHTTTVRSDGEPSIVAMLEALRDRIGRHESINEVVVQSAPLRSHQSMGSVRRSMYWVTTIYGRNIAFYDQHHRSSSSSSSSTPGFCPIVLFASQPQDGSTPFCRVHFSLFFRGLSCVSWVPWRTRRMQTRGHWVHGSCHPII